jgi:hypothetical protein
VAVSRRAQLPAISSRSPAPCSKTPLMTSRRSTVATRCAYARCRTTSSRTQFCASHPL